MALLGSSAINTPTSGLTPTYINSLIKEALDAQRQPINSLTAQKDQLNIRKAVYSDLKSKLLTLETIIDDLTNTDGNSVFDARTATSSDSDMLTATANSEAARGNYTISISNLAEAHRVRSDQQSDDSEPLNLSGSFTINGKSIAVDTGDSLDDIMSSINNAQYEDGKEVIATIVDNYLVLEAASTGTDNQITASDTSGNVLSSLGIINGGSFKNTLQSAENASFTVNGIQIARQSNTSLDDVIDGVTLNLLSETDATVKLVVTPDYTGIRAKISAFVTNFNSTVSYLTAKTRTTADQEKQIYSRAVLSGDTIFSRLKADLVVAVRQQTTLEPQPDDPLYLEDIGISVGNKLDISLNTNTLNSALESNFDGVMRLFDGVMDRFLYILEPFTTENRNTLDLYTDSVNTKVENIENRIERMEKLIKAKEELLIKQYGLLYLQNIEFNQQQFGMLDIYSNFSIRA